jgi:undecaprenyl-diphosphatase
MFEALIQLDRTLFLFFNSTLANPVFDVIFPFITKGRNWIIPGIIMAIVYCFLGKKKAFIVLGLAIVTIAVSDPVSVRILKPLFGRLRPCHPSHFVDGAHLFLEGGRFLFGYKTSLSFPSAHATNMFAQAMLLTLFYPKQAVWFFIFAFLIGYSRIHVGVHYPLDIVGGAIFGMGIGASVYLLYNYIWQRIRLKNQSAQQK